MPEIPIEMDDFDRSRGELPDIAISLVNEHGDLIRDRFLSEPSDPYLAYYGPRAAP